MFKLFIALITIFLSLPLFAQSVEDQLIAFKVEQQKSVRQLKPYREQSDLITQAYTDFGFEKLAERRSSLSINELNQLFEAQIGLNFYAKDNTHLASLESSFDELAKRDKVERKHVHKMFEQYITARRFDAAAALAKKYPAYDLEALPTIVDTKKLEKDARAIWVIHKTEKRLTREPAPATADWQLVVISHPLCHFSENALKHIKNDDALAKSLEGHLTLIGPQDGHLKFEVMQKWNTENPTMPIHPVDQQIAFTEFENWPTPTFYFMKAGKVIYKFNGWPKEGKRAQLDEGLSMVSARVVDEAYKK